MRDFASRQDEREIRPEELAASARSLTSRFAMEPVRIAVALPRQDVP